MTMEQEINLKNLHYEFTGETKEFGGVALRRIRAAKDLPNFGVKSGDVGGWIEHTGNLQGNAWVADEAMVSGYAEVLGGAKVYGNARVSGYAKVYDNAKVYGNARVFGNAQVYGNAKVLGYAEVFGNSEVYGNAEVYNDAKVFDNAQVFGYAEVYNDAKVFDNAQVFGYAEVYNDAKVFDNAEVYDDARIEDSTHYFHAITHTSLPLQLTLTRQKAGKHLIRLGCWEGTIDELEALISSETWVETSGDDADKARPEMLALCQMLRARIERWGQE